MKGNITLNVRQIKITALWLGFLFLVGLIDTNNVLKAVQLASIAGFISLGSILLIETYL